MDAPTYPPAAAFEQPVAAPAVWRLEDVSIAELLSHPAAHDILMKHLPSLKPMLSSMKSHLANMSVYSLATFGGVLPPQALTAIDVELAQLPPIEGSHNE